MDFLNQAFEKAREIETVKLEKEHGEDTQEESWAEQQITVDQPCAITTEVPNDGNSCISQTEHMKSEKGKTNVAENSRYKSGIELSKTRKRPRTCSYCKTEGHDSRTCEQRKDDQLASANANGGTPITVSTNHRILIKYTLHM
ncbi:hypothetical protein MKX01_009518 [Papaver californicum]|nr:hypothetical protein MKX01_009518 [Papaver californicum]